MEKGGKDSGADANSAWSHQLAQADQESDGQLLMVWLIQK